MQTKFTGDADTMRQTLEALDLLFDFAEKCEAADTLTALQAVLVHLVRECSIQTTPSAS